jgi:quinol monooxygenase YgiN
MVYVIAQLKLESYDNWKPVFDERKTMRNEMGSKEARLFRNSDNPNEVVILFEWDNMENARKYMESEELRKTLEKAGATFNVIYLNEIEKTT